MSYILILYSVSFLLFLCKYPFLLSGLHISDAFAVVLMLLHLYSAHADAKTNGQRNVKLGDEERPHANGHLRIPNDVDRQSHDAQEFELEGLMSDDEDEPQTSKANGRPRGT